MLDLVLNHIWQSTLIVFAAALLSLALRRQCARLRYWVWFGASLKFLIPFAALTLLGTELSWRTPPADAANGSRWQAVALQVIQPISIADSTGSPSTTLISRRSSPESDPGQQLPGARTAPFIKRFVAWLPASALLVWVLGKLTIAAIWTLRWTRLRRLAHRAKPVALAIPEADGIEIRVTAAGIEPGIFGIQRPMLLLPAGIVDRLSASQLAAIVRHERCHIDRRDNLTALIQMIVAAVFWFYPLVWWIGSRLIAERERACDEAVIAAGVHPHTYASGILEVCSVYLDLPLPCASGVGAGSLKCRIRRITANRATHQLGTARHALLLTLPGIALAAPFWAGFWTPMPARAQADSSQVGNEVVEAYLARRDYFAELGPLIRGPTTDQGETRFMLRLDECAEASPAATTDGAGVIGPLPAIESVEALVAYAFDTGDDRVVLTQDIQPLGLVVWNSLEVPIDHTACRASVRRSLQNDYGLVARLTASGDLVVDNLDWPGSPPDAVVLTAPGLDIDPETLDAYTGYFMRANSESTTLAPIFRIRREGPTLLIEWNGERFELAAISPTEFSAFDYLPAARRQELAARGIVNASEVQWVTVTADGRAFSVATQPTTLDLHFDSSNEISIVNDFYKRTWATNPIGRASRIDAETAEAALALLERRRTQTLPDPASESLVRDIVRILGPAQDDDNSPAAAAARRIRERLEQSIPGVMGRLGNPRISLLEVLPSGRDVFTVVYDWVAFRLTIGTDTMGRAITVTLDIDCERLSEDHIERFGSCTPR